MTVSMMIVKVAIPMMIVQDCPTIELYCRHGFDGNGAGYLVVEVTTMQIWGHPKKVAQRAF